MKFLAGIDEAGRGPLAGPVAVGVVVIKEGFDWSQIGGVTDSKKLTPKKRGEIFTKAKLLRKQKVLDFAVSMVSAKVIDEIGIAPAITLAMARAIKKLRLESGTCHIKLDGSLKVPAGFSQETIIRGDQKEKIIGLASICAKETRDAYMRKIAPQFSAYDFASHMGYGTKVHRAAIKKHGLSSEHRASFCANKDIW